MKILGPIALVWSLSFLLLIFATQPMLPVVMQDEFVYRDQVVHLAFAQYGLPNYLFGLTSRVAEAAGNDFYFVIKAWNALVASTASSSIFGAVRMILGTRFAVLATATYLVAPGFLQTSFYMPDMFVSSFLAMTVCLLLLALHNDRGARDPLWMLAALPFILALLSKPHAIIALVGVILVAALHSFKLRSVSPLFFTVIATFLGRLALGWLFAGAAGLDLFGRTYTEGLFGSDIEFGATIAAGLPGTSLAAGANANLPMAFLFEFSQLLGVFTLWSLGTLFVLLFRSGKDPVNLFLAVLILTSLLAVALFETLVGYLGDDHSGRVLTRHVEYLTPFVLAFGLAELKSIKFRSISSRGLPAIAFAASFFGFVSLLSLPMTRASDGTFVALSSQWSQGFSVVLLGLNLALWASKMFGAKSIPLFLSGALLVTSSVAAGNLRAQFSSATQVDLAGKELASLGVLRNRDVVVISDSKAAAELMRFYLVPKSSSQRIVGEVGLIDITSIELPDRVFIPVGDLELVSNCLAVAGTHFEYYDCGGAP